MMKKREFSVIGVLAALGLVITFLLGNPAVIRAQEKCFPIHIRTHAGIEPQILEVAKGDCVVWINWAREENVKVIFREGKKCADMTKAPVKFKPDFSGCYLTDYLGFGETSSLIFVEAGKVDYDVEFTRIGSFYGAGAGTNKLSGTIVVK
jgi:hypothetical protein